MPHAGVTEPSAGLATVAPMVQRARLDAPPEGRWRVVVSAVAMLLGAVATLVVVAGGLPSLDAAVCGIEQGCSLVLLVLAWVLLPALLALPAGLWLRLGWTWWCALVLGAVAVMLLVVATDQMRLALSVLFVPVGAALWTQPTLRRRWVLVSLAAAAVALGVLAAWLL